LLLLLPYTYLITSKQTRYHETLISHHPYRNYYFFYSNLVVGVPDVSEIGDVANTNFVVPVAIAAIVKDTEIVVGYYSTNIFHQ